MARDERLLYVRAAEIDRVYIGGMFCPDEPKMREMFEKLTPDQALAMNAAKVAVQRRQASPLEARTSLGEHPSFADTAVFSDDKKTSASHRVLEQSTEACLARIGTGQCLAYPPIDASDGSAV